ncbi:MAG: hypothetical protein PHY09_09920 [Desulfuromonadaceae bacterium]|nr:hypothetical protein [Desulfuromonadaceae bacterium]MDD5104698.1 hypothetical protein [Desulfuromonadaceae bacterium]
MAERRARTLILLFGILISVSSLCHAQETGKLFDVKMPQEAVAPVLVPEPAITPNLSMEPAKPDRKVPEKSWFRRLLEGTAIGAATYNTEKHSDGRPQVNTYGDRP